MSDASPKSRVALAERPVQVVFELAHAAPVGVALVVHAKHVQDPVDEQLTELGLERHAASSRLALGGIERDDHVTQHVPAILGARSLEQREREHVGRTPRSPEVPGDLGDDLVAGQGDGQFGITEAQGA